MALFGDHAEFAVQVQQKIKELRIMLEVQTGILFPGCVVGCANSSQHFLASIGTTNGNTPMRTDAIFDIASHTKMFLHTLALMLFSVEELKSIKVSDYLKMTGDFRNDITLYHLVTFGVDYGYAGKRLSDHTSKETILNYVLNGDLPYEPGRKFLYTDISSILLGMCLEKHMGKNLEQLFTEYIFKQYGITDISYKPDSSRLIVPSQENVVVGTPNTESARYFRENGASGLFASTPSILTFFQNILNRKIHSEDLLLRMIQNQFVNETFLLGWGALVKNEQGIFINEDPVLNLKKNCHTGGHGFILPFNNFTFICYANICYPTREGADRDGFTAFCKKVSTFLFENREYFLGEFNQTPSVNFTH
jgi:CubicO group peptidase (beta-lactamase class C family)